MYRNHVFCVAYIYTTTPSKRYQTMVMVIMLVMVIMIDGDEECGGGDRDCGSRI